MANIVLSNGGWISCIESVEQIIFLVAEAHECQDDFITVFREIRDMDRQRVLVSLANIITVED